MDVSQVLFNIMIIALSLFLAKITYDIGKLTRYPKIWSLITIGFALLPISRIFFLIASFETPLQKSLVDYGSIVVVILLLIHVLGFYYLKKATEKMLERT